MKFQNSTRSKVSRNQIGKEWYHCEWDYYRREKPYELNPSIHSYGREYQGSRSRTFKISGQLGTLLRIDLGNNSYELTLQLNLHERKQK